MNKQDLIEYFREVWPYLKLSTLCEEYNCANPQNAIDYNNLRIAIKDSASNRLSEEKLVAFYDFLTKDIFQAKFKLKGNGLCSTQIEQIVNTKSAEMISQISEALSHGFSNK